MVRDQTTENLGDGEPQTPDYDFASMRALVFETAKKTDEMYQWYQKRKRQQLTGPLDSATRKLIQDA